MTGRRELSKNSERDPGATRRQAVILIGVSVMFAIAAFNPGTARAVDNSENAAESFMQLNIDRGYTILNSTTLSEEQRHAEFREFMVALTDTRRIGMFTLGPFVNRSSPDEIETFVQAFTDYAVVVYETRLSKYKGQTLRVTGSQERADDDVIVNADVVNPANPNAPTFKASFRVRKDADGMMIVTDMQVEGIWLALSQRSDITGFLQQHNGRIGELVADLRRQTQQLRSGAQQAGR